MVVITDSQDTPLDRLNSRSTFESNCNPFTFKLVGLSVLAVFSLPRWRLKSNSISIEDSSSVSLAEDIAVQAVAELPLLSEELDE